VVDLTPDEPCDVGTSRRARLRIPDRGISYSHAKISLEDGAYVLRDLRSTEGTFVNGTRIEEVRLKPGDEIMFGKTRVRFIADGAPPPAEAAPPPATGRFQRP